MKRPHTARAARTVAAFAVADFVAGDAVLAGAIANATNVLIAGAAAVGAGGSTIVDVRDVVLYWTHLAAS